LPYGYLSQDTTTSFPAVGPGVYVTLPYKGHPSSPPVVDTVHGKVLGKFISLEGFAQPVAVFLGIPFAKPPVGPLRFTPPQPAEPWSFVKNATSYPPMCSQDAVAGQVLSELFTNRKENISVKVSEDCLYLNIYTPADLTKKNRLPVMVWIHGGGLMVGAASTYDGLALAAHENVVVVTIQYRLGIWGFFSKLRSLLGVKPPPQLSWFTACDRRQKRSSNSSPWIDMETPESTWEVYILFSRVLHSGLAETLALHVTDHYAGAPTYMYEFQYRPSFSSDMKPKTVIGDHGDEIFSVLGAPFLKDAGAPVYFYEFRHRPQCFEDTKPAFVKADHADEVRFVFGGAFLKGDIVMF
ncbi:PREDICTED: liver carboxylesterase 1-like, partial [Colobus angolensis palliatus]|uniref:liver carboxylesterase 1-like n=1 Tax=Colobus angolensis palliatus TaxID=336983 RepID=UPI0005F476A6